MFCVLDWCQCLISLSAQSCVSDHSWIVTSLAGWSISVRSSSETMCLFTHRCQLIHGLCSLHSYMVFQSALTIFTVNITKSPKPSLKSCRWVFSLSMKKLSWRVMSMMLFPFSFKTLKHSSHEFPCKDAELWYNLISTNNQTKVKIEIVNLRRWKH